MAEMRLGDAWKSRHSFSIVAFWPLHRSRTSSSRVSRKSGCERGRWRCSRAASRGPLTETVNERSWPSRTISPQLNISGRSAPAASAWSSLRISGRYQGKHSALSPRILLATVVMMAESSGSGIVRSMFVECSCVEAAAPAAGQARQEGRRAAPRGNTIPFWDSVHTLRKRMANILASPCLAPDALPATSCCRRC